MNRAANNQRRKRAHSKQRWILYVKNSIRQTIAECIIKGEQKRMDILMAHTLKPSNN